MVVVPSWRKMRPPPASYAMRTIVPLPTFTCTSRTEKRTPFNSPGKLTPQPPWPRATAGPERRKHASQTYQAADRTARQGTHRKLTAARLTYGPFLAPLLIVVNTVVAVLTPAENRAEAFSWVGAALGLGLAIGSTVVGYALDASGEVAGRQLTVLLALGPVLFSLLWAWHYAATGRRTAGQ